MRSRPSPDLVRPLLAVAVVAGLLLLLLGAWPPLVAVESGSMAPTVERGDLVVVTAAERFPWGGLAGDGTASSRTGTPRGLDGGGDVVVFSPPDDDGRPILHRVAFVVEAGEDWTKRGDPGLIDGDCSELRHCPAPHDGYVTYGDANGEYDQSAGIAPIVRPEWIRSKALVSIPALGWLRLGLDLAFDRFGAFAAVGFVAVAAAVGGTTAVVVGRVRDRR